MVEQTDAEFIADLKARCALHSKTLRLIAMVEEREREVERLRAGAGVLLLQTALAPPQPPVNGPGHTDLMVSPESIDAFLEANPLPIEPRKQTGAEMNITDALIDECCDLIDIWPRRWDSTESRRAEMREALVPVFLAGRIAQAEEDAALLREQLTEAKRQEQRVTLAIAIRAIERGRNLTDEEKMKNLMDALYCEARASTKEEK